MPRDSTGEKGHVLRTTDFGETWEILPLPTQPNATVWGLATHPADADRIRRVHPVRRGLRHRGRRRLLAQDRARIRRDQGRSLGAELMHRARTGSARESVDIAAMPTSSMSIYKARSCEGFRMPAQSQFISRH